MRRRQFITLIGGAAAAWPLAARAQQPGRIPRIGMLMSIARDAETESRVTAFEQSLHTMGWTIGQNVRIDRRWAGGDANRIRGYAAELVAIAPDVIVAIGTAAVSALQRETGTIPIVFANISDPVGSGLVASLSHPGGNTTGFATFEYSIGAKWLEIIKEIVPRINRVAVLLDRQLPSSAGFLAATQAAASSFGVEVTTAGVRTAAEIESTINSFVRGSNDGLITLPSPMTTVHRERIVALAARHRLPGVYPYRYFPTNGGLVSYTVDIDEIYRRAASYVDRILKGANPSDLPVQAPTKFELVINLKTAKALGLTVPATLLALANEVIE